MELDVSPEERAILSARLLKSMQESLYSNRMLIAPRRIREVANEEIDSLLSFLLSGNRKAAAERGTRLAAEGLGQRSIINMTSTLRLAGWEIARHQHNTMEMVTAVDAYTTALLDGYMAAYEEDLRREQQRTHDAYVRTLSSS
jgi:hypothetical protein